MAGVARHRTAGTRATKFAGIDKENMSPKRTTIQQKHRKTQDANGIFNHQQRVAEQHGLVDRTRNALSPKFTGISKPLAGKPGYFTRMEEGRRAKVAQAQAQAAKASVKKGASTPNVETLYGMHGPHGLHGYAQRQKEHQKAISFGIAGQYA